MDELTKKKLAAFDYFVDLECELEHPTKVIHTLISLGFTKEDLLELNFQEEDIDWVLSYLS